MSDDFTSLPGTLDAVWARLEAGVREAEAPARTIALATRPEAGGAAVRMVVLRRASRMLGEVEIYTHLASAKVADLRSDSRAQLLVWDPAAQFQIRLSVTVAIEDGPTEVWESLGPGARLNYATAPDPGEPVEDPTRLIPDPDPGLFLLLRARIEAIETLHLGTDCHRRARFAAPSATWLAP
ncbi:MAG: pyridoxamine 5'-phosphate oxidase family protein [Paracoccaceae bacterium]|nr:pyridoxamine 5'-phosphate oxidase family protein [Paracoccaceae bacterium]